MFWSILVGGAGGEGGSGGGDCESFALRKSDELRSPLTLTGYTLDELSKLQSNPGTTTQPVGSLSLFFFLLLLTDDSCEGARVSYVVTRQTPFRW